MPSYILREDLLRERAIKGREDSGTGYGRDSASR